MWKMYGALRLRHVKAASALSVLRISCQCSVRNKEGHTDVKLQLQLLQQLEGGKGEVVRLCAPVLKEGFPRLLESFSMHPFCWPELKHMVTSSYIQTVFLGAWKCSRYSRCLCLGGSSNITERRENDPEAQQAVYPFGHPNIHAYTSLMHWFQTSWPWSSIHLLNRALLDSIFEQLETLILTLCISWVWVSEPSTQSPN